MSKVVNLPVSCALGEAQSADGRRYKLAVGRERLMVQSRQTGQQTAISWDELVAVAGRAGLDLDGELGGPDAAA
jgi:hypothetical protein